MSEVISRPPAEAATGSAPPSLSADLYQQGQAAWQAAVNHPMVAAIGTGQLPHATFRFYFEQNVCYLEEYARAIALVIAKAPDRRSVTVLTRFLNQIVEHEIPANLEFLDALGGTPLQNPLVAMTPTAYAYTRHILQVCGQHGAAAGLTAVLPCQWSYGEIGQRLAASVPSDPVCAAWVALFSEPGYEDLVHESTDLLDRLAEGITGTERAALLSVFSRSTFYEAEFWDMAFRGPVTTGDTDQGGR
jgi:thiaminase/transcriptional activator TenA